MEYKQKKKKKKNLECGEKNGFQLTSRGGVRCGSQLATKAASSLYTGGN